LAGPIATRFLAGFGAQVLRIDPPDRDEPGLVAETTLGKRCAQLDLRKRADRAIFETLLAHADVFVHGYRPGALDGLGFGAARRAGGLRRAWSTSASTPMAGQAHGQRGAASTASCRCRAASPTPACAGARPTSRSRCPRRRSIT